MQNKLSTKKGFTLIEIVIALAIAALIIVVVLLAVQGAQRSQRNDARRALADRTRAAISDARSNKGSLGGVLSDQDVQNALSNRTGENNVQYNVSHPAITTGGGSCGVSTNVFFSELPDRAAICLEGTGSGTWYLSQ